MFKQLTNLLASSEMPQCLNMWELSESNRFGLEPQVSKCIAHLELARKILVYYCIIEFKILCSSFMTKNFDLNGVSDRLKTKVKCKCQNQHKLLVALQLTSV